MHFPHAPQVEDEQNAIRYEQCAMTVHRNSYAEAAIQYLTWALEDIEKTGNQKAAHHVRLAIEALHTTDEERDLA